MLNKLIAPIEQEQESQQGEKPPGSGHRGSHT